MYLIESGRSRIAEHGLDVKPGDIVGELGMLLPGNRRIGSLACVEPGSAPESGIRLLLPQADDRAAFSQGTAQSLRPENAGTDVP